MINIVFVILHYLTTEDTVECINSIRDKCKNVNYKIVIVDNASPNNSGEKLSELYRNSADADLILLDTNVGFAKGNNAGIEFARKKYSPRFIVAMNNDVILLQNNIVDLIEHEYRKSGFAVLGPMVYTADGRCNDNPGTNVPMTMQELDAVIKDAKKYYFLCKWNLRSIYGLIEKIKNRIKKRKDVRSQYNDYLSTKYNVQLHGCFLCFSEKYFEHFDGFFSKTFLYLEEDILFCLTQKENLKTVYLPELKVYHKEDSSSKAAWKSNKEREKKKARFVQQSAEAFKNYLATKSK